MKIIIKHRLLLKFQKLLRQHRKIILIISAILIIFAGFLSAYIISLQKPVKKPIVVKTVKPEPIKYYSLLTGNQVSNKNAIKKPITGIMIENSPDARPQSGLKNSEVVFEAIAEGGITRFLVFYQQKNPKLIGPVRSIRLYDVEWLAAFNASIGHVGGSAAALREVRNGNYRDNDQFFNSGSYWRATDRYAPHNVYTSFDKLDALNKSKGYTTSTFTSFSRKDGKPSKKPNATSLNINISGYLYNSSYIYDKTSNSYKRFQAGEAHLDREDGQIKPSVIIALRVDMENTLEDGYRENITTIGKGEAIIFQDGTAIEATWHKAGRLSQITFTDESGNDVPLVRGQTWISAVPNGSGDVTWE